MGCEKPDNFPDDGSPNCGGPTGGAVALLVKSPDFPDADTDSEENRGKGGDPHHQRIPSASKLSKTNSPSSAASARLAANFGGAAIVIEGVGVFVKSNIDAGLCPLSEFESDPTAISPYRVASSISSAAAPLLYTSSVPLDASSTDNGYASTVDGRGSSCADQDVVSLPI